MLRGLDRQATVLSELRQRASIVLSASGIVASLFGTRALEGEFSHTLAALAVASTAAGFLACIAVLWRVRDSGALPTEDAHGKLSRGGRNWQVTISGPRLRRIASGNENMGDLIDVLALSRRVNFRTLKRRSAWFLVACGLLLLELLLWAAVLFDKT
jgi:hypothetical protein